ncbi:hypothetical protein SLS62_010980 [Diatrype stigma]|uniref:Uncharacterized protein n=1 Tax=Diatrype stigma TaxID=117547 RepID=A0AAN9U6D3_9PEZI
MEFPNDLIGSHASASPGHLGDNMVPGLEREIQIHGFVNKDVEAEAAKMAPTWDYLKVQVNLFNRIISVPITCFQRLDLTQKHALLALMRQTIFANDVHYAQDISYADRIYLGSALDFERTSLHFLAMPIGEPQPVSQQQPEPVIASAPGLVTTPFNMNAVDAVKEEPGMD